jgi:hypothetical protein
MKSVPEKFQNPLYFIFHLPKHGLGDHDIKYWKKDDLLKGIPLCYLNLSILNIT